MIAERLAQTWWRIEVQMADLRDSRQRIDRAHSYLAGSRCHWSLGQGYLEVAHQSHQRRLRQLLASRLRALKLSMELDALLEARRKAATPSRSLA